MTDDLELLYAGGAKNAHDAFFKTVFRHPANALALVKAVAPPELAAGLDPASFRLEHCTFVTEELDQKHADLLFWAKLHGRDTLVYFLFEHLSTSRAEAALTMYRYAGEALRHAYDTMLPGGERRGLPLPAILPVVVHHSATGWQHATSLRELYALDGVPESL